MIEANNPEINVDELMKKVQKEVDRRQSLPQPDDIQSNARPTAIYLGIHYIEALLKTAESRAVVRTKWPDNLNRFPFNLSRGLQKLALKILNSLFKDQREVNFNVFRAIREAATLNQHLITEVAALRSQIGEQLRTTNTWIDEELRAMDTRISRHRGVVDTHLQRLGDRVDANDSQIESLIAKMQGSIDAANSKINEQLQAMDTRIQGLDERYIKNDSYLKNDLMQQKRLIAMFLEEARQRLPEPFDREQLQTFSNEDPHQLDGFYAAFEERFRGSRDDLRNKLKVYLPIIERVEVGAPDSLILDVGCGRGEWLELLQESGYIAKGLEINRVTIEQCRARGLEVIESDAIAYLQSLPDSSLGVVTGFHIIEHLPFPLLIKFLQETVRVIKPGGLAIFETPNPQNILVGSNNFYMDPTHQNPLPNLLTKFLLEYVGFDSVEVMHLNPYDESFKVESSAVADIFNQYFYGPQDYGVIGYKV